MSLAERNPAGAMKRDELLQACAGAVGAAERLVEAARGHVRETVSREGRLDAALLDQRQFAVHGLAWYATYVEALRQALGWAERLAAEDRFGDLERLLLEAAFAGYLAELEAGIAMSQVEVVRPRDLGLEEDDLEDFHTAAVRRLLALDMAELRSEIGTAIRDGYRTGSFGDPGLDETLRLVGEQFRRFADEHVAPYGHAWHMADRLIPLDTIQRMNELGVFGLTIPEEYGGHGLGKGAMVLVSEELSRAYIGVGSLGTRSEIAAELILNGGSEAQKRHWLPRIASGEILPTAVFTEPNVGSDLANLRTRAARDGDDYRITGAKTWITHAARADLMTLLVRTGAPDSGYRGLSMFLAEKPRGSDADPFPVDGLDGEEIPVLGYRGMKEYTLSFDGFRVPAANLLGEAEGNGFKQLMTTFEAARIQTAARAVGVAQSALELGLRYAGERQQFGRAIYDFPRVHGKLAWMAVETMLARQLTYHAARAKDSGRRCDLEAGMAKLLAARVAWSSADNALQVHGGNGFAMEYPISRVLCDARILNIFEGAGEIQAQVIARRLLDERN